MAYNFDHKLFESNQDLTAAIIIKENDDHTYYKNIWVSLANWSKKG